MAATPQSQAVLHASAAKLENCRVIEGQNAIDLVMRRADLFITITVHREVEEWFVDVEEPATGLKARDWYDYAGYESRGSQDLDREMAEDLKSFIENLVGKPLRIRPPSPREAGGLLEWQIGGAWTRAVPG